MCASQTRVLYSLQSAARPDDHRCTLEAKLLLTKCPLEAMNVEGWLADYLLALRKLRFDLRARARLEVDLHRARSGGEHRRRRKTWRNAWWRRHQGRHCWSDRWLQGKCERRRCLGVRCGRLRMCFLRWPCMTASDFAAAVLVVGHTAVLARANRPNCWIPTLRSIPFSSCSSSARPTLKELTLGLPTRGWHYGAWPPLLPARAAS